MYIYLYCTTMFCCHQSSRFQNVKILWNTHALYKYDLRSSCVYFKKYWSYIQFLVQTRSYEVRNLLWCNTHLRFYCLYIAQDLLTKDKILIPLWMNYNLLNTMNHKYGIFKISFLIITNTICNINISFESISSFLIFSC